MPNVLITGASGFIGKSVANYLANRGYDVIGVTRNAADKHKDNFKCINEWIELDLQGDISKLSGVVKCIDYVIHLAGLSSRYKNVSMNVYLQNNVEITEKLALLAAESPAIKRFIHVSTIKVHGEKTGEKDIGYFDESSPIKPSDNYGKSKYLGEKALRKIAEVHQMEYVIFRPPLVFGRGVGGNFFSLIKLVEKNIPLPFAMINNSRSILYTENFSDAIFLSFRHEMAKNETFVIKDVTLSFPELITKISHAMNRQPRIFRVPVRLLKFAGVLTGRKASIDKITDSLRIDDSKIRERLDWNPVVDINKSINATVQWYLGGK